MITELKNKIKAIPLSTIIGHYIPIKKTETNYIALCPFHFCHTPSLYIDDTNGLFKCMECRTGGDAITFVQKYKDLEFVPALEEISNLILKPHTS